MYLADLHIHSAYSRATSKDCDAPHLELWARRKGLGLVGTGDFTHPAWRAELKKALVPAEEGLYALKTELTLPEASTCSDGPVRFVVSGEISSIYKRGGKTRKVHNLILLPSLEAADALATRLERIGNIHSDGRPILGLDSRDLLEITLDTCPDAMFIPAHIWTPHFSLFGAFSGFDTIEECFGDLTGEIHALETGLSSDPPMNWRISALDSFTLVSNSDAHSPGKLGREANLIDGPLTYPGLKRAICTGSGFVKTLEFFPEEGKYHLDGHRKCNLCLTSEETDRVQGICPVCGRKLTIGVQHRAWELADRPEGYLPKNAIPFESLVPLPEIIAASLGVSAESRKVKAMYAHMLLSLGPEFLILRSAAIADIARYAGPCIAEGVHRLRQGLVTRIPGFDGEYGKIQLFEAAEREALLGQGALFAIPAAAKEPVAQENSSVLAPQSNTSATDPANAMDIPQGDGLHEQPGATNPVSGPNPEQQAAIFTTEPAVAVIAGPGTGKTSTLVQRIVHLVKDCQVNPSTITAVTFTNQAAAEMRRRVAEALGDAAITEAMTIGTFHAICLSLTRDGRPLFGQDRAMELVKDILAQHGLKQPPLEALRRISAIKSGQQQPTQEDDSLLYQAYLARCEALEVRDLDDLLLDALALPDPPDSRFAHLLVDEFQDVNPIQRKLVQKWSQGGSSLFVIGDPDQSIYGFRGASAGCFDDLAQQFPALHTIKLTRNYRSTPEILQCACTLISHNPGDARQLIPACPSGPKVRLAIGDSALSQGIWIAKEIARITGGVDMLSATDAGRDHTSVRPFSDIAVLCRTHRQLEGIERCLVHDNIPCLISGREAYLDTEPVRQALSYFRAMLSQHQEGVSDPSQAMANDNPPQMDMEAPSLLFARYAEANGLQDQLERLIATAAFHQTMEAFLAMLALGEEADLRRANGKAYASGAVQLMTLHGAKGLEFPVVFLAGISEGELPLTRVSDETDVEEERRLFFVGLTRAKSQLILTCSEPLSPFLSEVGNTVTKERAFLRASEAQSRQLKLF